MRGMLLDMPSGRRNRRFGKVARTVGQTRGAKLRASQTSQHCDVPVRLSPTPTSVANSFRAAGVHGARVDSGRLHAVGRRTLQTAVLSGRFVCPGFGGSRSARGASPPPCGCGPSVLDFRSLFIRRAGECAAPLRAPIRRAGCRSPCGCCRGRTRARSGQSSIPDSATARASLPRLILIRSRALPR
jgi:hypothetical protein